MSFFKSIIKFLVVFRLFFSSSSTPLMKECLSVLVNSLSYFDVCGMLIHAEELMRPNKPINQFWNHYDSTSSQDHLFLSFFSSVLSKFLSSNLCIPIWNWLSWWDVFSLEYGWFCPFIFLKESSCKMELLYFGYLKELIKILLVSGNFLKASRNDFFYNRRARWSVGLSISHSL